MRRSRTPRSWIGRNSPLGVRVPRETVANRTADTSGTCLSSYASLTGSQECNAGGLFRVRRLAVVCCGHWKSLDHPTVRANDDQNQKPSWILAPSQPFQSEFVVIFQATNSPLVHWDCRRHWRRYGPRPSDGFRQPVVALEKVAGSCLPIARPYRARCPRSPRALDSCAMTTHL